MMDEAYPLTLHANGVSYRGKFSPWKIKSLLPAATTLTPPKNTRLFVAYLNIYVRTVAGDLATYAGVSGYTNNSGADFYYVALLPSTAQVINEGVPINILTDRGSTLSWATSAAVTDFACNVFYAEVEDGQ